jgi:electron transfer flavoprotein beta subunit
VNIVVAMKQIPDLQQVRIRDRKPIMDDVPLTFGNIDKNALELGVQIVEEHGGEVTVVSAGNEQLEDSIKEPLAAGADKAHIILCDKEIDSAASAELLAAAIKKIENVDLIILGEGSGDNYSSQVGSRVAAILDLPQVGYARHIELQGDQAVITRSLEDSEEIISLKLPAVITILSDVNEPRIPSVTQILKAGRKPKDIIEADEMGIEIKQSQIETIENLAPQVQRKQISLENAAELLTKLTAEGLLRRE